MLETTCAALLTVLSLSGSTVPNGAVAGDVQVVLPDGPAAADIQSWQNVVVWVEGDIEFEVPPETPVISQEGVRFTPSFQVVVVGQKVDMPNNDNVIHNVFSKSPANTFDLGFYPKGTSREVLFEQPGVVDLFCSVHRNMNAKVLVVPNVFFAETTPGGAFTIPDLPPGEYTLRAWHRDFPLQSAPLVIEEGATVSVSFVFEGPQAS